jgi:hypothetical protein
MEILGDTAGTSGHREESPYQENGGPLNGLVAVIGMDFYPTRPRRPFSQWNHSPRR